MSRCGVHVAPVLTPHHTMCTTPAGELNDLISRLQQLAATAGGAPLMTVQQPGRVSSASADAAAAAAAGERSAHTAAANGGAEGSKADDWEFV